MAKWWPAKESGYNDTPPAQATWNIKSDQQRMLSEKLDILMSMVASVKIYDVEAIKKVNAALEVVYETIRSGLWMHYKEFAEELDITLKVSRELLNELLPHLLKNSMPSELTKAFIESIEMAYRLLNKALYMTGLGITLEQKMSQKEMIERALLD
jgi:hypothetical protein